MPLYPLSERDFIFSTPKSSSDPDDLAYSSPQDSIPTYPVFQAQDSDLSLNERISSSSFLSTVQEKLTQENACRSYLFNPTSLNVLLFSNPTSSGCLSQLKSKEFRLNPVLSEEI